MTYLLDLDYKRESGSIVLSKTFLTITGSGLNTTTESRTGKVAIEKESRTVPCVGRDPG